MPASPVLISWPPPHETLRRRPVGMPLHRADEQLRLRQAESGTSVAEVIRKLGIAIPFSSVGGYLGFTRLPTLYWPLLVLSLLSYAMLTQGFKTWLLRRKWI